MSISRFLIFSIVVLFLSDTLLFIQKIQKVNRTKPQVSIQGVYNTNSLLDDDLYNI